MIHSGAHTCIYPYDKNRDSSWRETPAILLQEHQNLLEEDEVYQDSKGSGVNITERTDVPNQKLKLTELGSG